MKRFSQSLRERKAAGFLPLIPDFKRVSPKHGELFSGRDPVFCAQRLAALGAPAVSVVTEQARFGGSLALLSSICKAVEIPVLRKDFITCRADLEQTCACGAQAVLLICACLDEKTLAALYEDALVLGLEPLVEAHSEKELAICRSLDARLVGINNRDILDLERDAGTVAHTAALAAERPAGALLISESGMESPADVRRALEAGADAALVGTALWRAPDLFTAYCAFGGMEK